MHNMNIVRKWKQKKKNRIFVVCAPNPKLGNKHMATVLYVGNQSLKFKANDACAAVFAATRMQSKTNDNFSFGQNGWFMAH